MAKRKLSSAGLPPAKRRRDIFSTLSDELLVRVLSYMDERTLLAIAPVSRRFHRVTADSQLWRPHYYRRFILPRAHRIPGFRRRRPHKSAPPDEAVDWKQQYRLRHNWARGRCAVDEVPVRHGVAAPCTLVKVVDGLAVTVDGTSGLRVWDLKTRKAVVQTDMDAMPTCLAVDDVRLSSAVLDVAVGFADGTFAIWRLENKKLHCVYRHAKSFFGELVAVAYGYPYVLTASRMGFISLYTFDSPPSLPSPGPRRSGEEFTPRLLTSLKSHSTRPPLALSIRRTAASVVASIAYTFDAVGGWSIGIQDLDINDQSVVTSRVAYTLPTATRNTPPSSPTQLQTLEPDEDGPSRLCYSHPYLLATLPDNTLVLHLCTATSSSLSISEGTRLWGHTSGISDAEITPRGKAVSVSMRGDEIRVWEVEGRVGGRSVEVKPQTGGGMGVDERRNWVGFDDEMVVVLKERGDGRESLMVYDFT